ncbi:MAG: cation transporter [Oscillospiraceae bacterium]|jgi:copper chaperone CopZ|nr:cation transporter [Oscillospiraceae bacterium]
MTETILKIDGMSCGHCEIAIQDAIRKLPGIKKVQAKRRKAAAKVRYDAAQVTVEQLVSAVSEIGYTVVN